MRWLSLWSLLLVCACGTRTELPVGDGGGTAGTGVADAGSLDGGGNVASPTTFVLENQGVAPILVGNQCGGLWLSLSRGDESLLVDRSCECDCRMPDFCGCPAICRITEQLLVPGQRTEEGWDGVAAAIAPGKSCYTASVPPTGKTLGAEACWNVDDQSGARNCVSETFLYGIDTEVTLAAKPAAIDPVTTAIELKNETGGPIEIVVNRCGSQGWFNIARGAEPLSTSTFCPCACDDEFELSECPACGACAPDVIQTLEPGETQALTWDGKFWYTYPSSCQRRYDMPPIVMVEAKACWSAQGESAQRCATANFTHGQAEPVKLVAR
jgi:hypothetical protein